MSVWMVEWWRKDDPEYEDGGSRMIFATEEAANGFVELAKANGETVVFDICCWSALEDAEEAWVFYREDYSFIPKDQRGGDTAAKVARLPGGTG